MPWCLDHLQADIAHLESIALGEQARRLPRVGRLNAPHSSLFLDVRMRHRHILSTQLILTALANGGSHAGNTTNMIGMAMSAYGAKHAYAGMLGSNMLYQALAFPCGVDNHTLIVRNNSIAIGLNGTVYERLDLDRSLGSYIQGHTTHVPLLSIELEASNDASSVANIDNVARSSRLNAALKLGSTLAGHQAARVVDRVNAADGG